MIINMAVIKIIFRDLITNCLSCNNTLFIQKNEEQEVHLYNVCKFVYFSAHSTWRDLLVFLAVCLSYQCNLIVILLISLRNVQEWRNRNRKALECKDQRGESCYFKKEQFDLFIKSKCFQRILSLSSIAIYCHKDHEDNAMREGFQSQESILDCPCH